ncbi:class E sortase [Bifidobacterium cuniculi]|uniref:Sortase family protein n=1 Tax=Bifidobacterium cuniculi TaxID=1688 RepID=A0A087ATG0_9BIFI|nr:class E sortase [Bifidobacterium cuniculi]KFI62060.1 sortase family protein [Bifidobacterium cuniculi]
MKHAQTASAGGSRVGRSIVTIIAEILLTAAAICGLYVGWMQWWTGVQSAHVQEQSVQSVDWTQPDGGGTLTIAQPQDGEPPVQPESAAEGELMARVYIPRFGDQWERTLVQGTSLAELNLHGLGHYVISQMPGELGNFAIAGHRNGYGQPLGDVDKLEAGDAIVIRTKDYWYVYQYTQYTIVTPDDGSVIGPNPLDPGQAPTKRMITMTTCEPKYTTPTHRWISFGELKYWAKVADGVPSELAHVDADGAVQFINNGKTSVFTKLGSLAPVVVGSLVAYAVLFVICALWRRWPALRAIREGRRPQPDVDFYAWLWRHQPGPAAMRWVLVLLLLLAAVAALFQWGFPWAAGEIPFLRAMSNYVSVS